MQWEKRETYWTFLETEGKYEVEEILNGKLERENRENGYGNTNQMQSYRLLGCPD